MVAPDALKKQLSVAYVIDDAVLRQPLFGDPLRVRQVSRQAGFNW